ncbi:hypothetical protein DIZ76_010569 [Coccidioides immitis]|nr:hypothetical protein DIZ76_010569 [Coccidioides immitis]
MLPNQTTAIVGKLGGGKSMIFKLLLQFYDLKAGAICIDGQDITGVMIESLQATFGIVPQTSELFNGTITENIRIAKPDATDDDVAHACDAAALHDTVMGFPDQYNTMVGVGGKKLSSSELQRVAIAQAFIKDPNIVLLDEATSSLDSKTEARVQQSLTKLCAGQTMMVIAHHLSTIAKADQILVVNDSKIMEEGTHSELLEQGGHYHYLCNLQGVFTSIKDDSSSTCS